MAIIKIHPIKSILNFSIDYITKNEKTDEKILVSSFKCQPSIDYIQFIKTREYNDNKGTVLAIHLIQSFLPGEVESNKAHEIELQYEKKNTFMQEYSLKKEKFSDLVKYRKNYENYYGIEVER